MVFKIVGTQEEKTPTAKKFKIVSTGEREVSPKSREIAEGLKFFGKETFTPEQIESARRKAGIVAKKSMGVLGVPGNIQQLIETLIRIKSPFRLPTSTQLEESFETLAGEKFRPTTKGEERLSKITGLTSQLLFPLGGEVQPIRSALAGILGTGAEELTELLGAPEAVKTGASILGTLIPFLTRRGAPIPPSKAVELAKREAIELPAAAIAPKLPVRRLKLAKETPKVLERKLKFEKSIEKAKDRILESVTPVAKGPKEAQAISKLSGKLFSEAEKKANLIKGPVPTSNLNESLAKNINRFERSTALSTEETSTLNFLNKIQKGLEVKNTTSNLLALNKSLNKEINFLKPTTGDKALLDVKDALLKDISSVGKRNPEFYKDWKRANKLYSEFSKFNEIRQTLAPAFSESGVNINKFANLFTDVKKQNKLTRLLGKEQYDRLKEISKLSVKGEQIFKDISKDPKLFRIMERMGNYAIMGAVLGRSKVGVGAIILEKGVMHLLRGYYGRLMTDPNFSNHYLNLLKSLKIGSRKGIISAANKVNQDIEKTKKDLKD